jgi:hypothetical protein
MGVAITLCNDTKHKRRKDKHHDSFFRRSEAESLPHFVQFGVPFQRLFFLLQPNYVTYT